MRIGEIRKLNSYESRIFGGGRGNPLYPVNTKDSFLNASGQGTALFTLPPATSPSLAGLIVHHAFTLLGTPFVSNPCPARLLP